MCEPELLFELTRAAARADKVGSSGPIVAADTFLQDAFPKVDPMELQDMLKEKKWNVDAVIDELMLSTSKKPKFSCQELR